MLLNSLNASHSLVRSICNSGLVIGVSPNITVNKLDFVVASICSRKTPKVELRVENPAVECPAPVTLEERDKWRDDVSSECLDSGGFWK